MVTSTEDIGLRTIVWRSPRLIIEPSVRLFERPVPSSRIWVLVQGIFGNSRRPISRQSTLPSRCSVRIDTGSPEGVLTPSRTGEVIGGDYVCFLLTGFFPIPPSFFFPVVKLISLWNFSFCPISCLPLRIWIY